MKQHIAKLLVFLMLMTTMIVPADLSFAESGNENTTQAEESNAPQEKLDSTQETPVKSTDDERIVENELSPDSSVAKESIIAAENDQLEETMTERMEFLYIESKELVTPGTQNIVVSWKEAIDDIQNMVLVYENEQGKRLTLKESKRNDESIVFTKDFAASEAGTYKIKGVEYFVGNEEKYFAFDDVEIAASFKVVKGQTIEDDAIAKVEVESDGTVDKKEVNAEIKDAVTSTDAAPKKQTKARRAKSSNIVVVLDPGHGGSDSGATRGSVYEKNINFKVAQYCKAELEQYCGVTVYMTRTGDTNPSLQERAQIAANYGANILVSIHQNSGSSSAYGAEVYYPNRNYKPAIGDSGKAVADSIQKELVSLGLSNRGTKIRNTANGSTYADGSYSDYYGIIRNSKNLGIPAIIVEHAFLSNASDYNNFLSSDSKLQKLGVADATGIAKAFGLSKGKWESTAEGKKYKYADGSYAIGYVNIGGKYYYFDDKGYMQKNHQMIDGKPYQFYGEGYGYGAGWINYSDGKKAYCEGGGKLKIGYVNIGGKYYYFDDKGYMQKNHQMINGKPYQFYGEGYGYGAGWINYSDGKKAYCYGGGKLAVGNATIDGKSYNFDSNGFLVKSAGWKKDDKGMRYQFADKTYAIGYVNIGGKYYYFDDKGYMQKNHQMIDGKPYQFYGEGYGYGAGWINYSDGKKAYCEGGGKLKTGYVNIGGKYYYFDDKGYMQKNHQMINGKPYQFYGEGYGYGTGWINYSDGKKAYCYGGGKLAVGNATIDGKNYSFDSNGFLVKSAGWKKDDKGMRYQFADKTYAIGYVNIGGKYYYFDDKGYMQKNHQMIDGKPYQFYGEGYGYGAGWINYSDGKKAYCEGGGKLKTGYVNIGGKYYYFDDKGYMQKNHQMINGKPYQFYGEGYGYGAGWINYSDGKKAYCYGGGKLAVGNATIDGKNYSFDSNGFLVKSAGWKKDDKGMRYQFADKTYAIGYVNIGGKYYYFDDKGYMQKNHQMIDGKPYQFYGEGYGYGAGWINYSDGKKAYCEGGGKLKTGYVNIGGKYYYFDDKGYMQKNHQMIDGKPYQFYGEGYGYGAGWINYSDGKKAYCYGGGKLAVGNATIDGKNYSFNGQGFLEGHAITGKASTSAETLKWLYEKRSSIIYPSFYKNTEASDLLAFCQIYVEEAETENINVEVAFCQAMLETGWLKFGGAVKIDQFNFAGIGATDGGSSGASFTNPRRGIRAHVQHLKAYANEEALVNPCVDPRFGLVKRGSAPYVEWLGQKENPNGYGWATRKNYGYSILDLIGDIK